MNTLTMHRDCPQIIYLEPTTRCNLHCRMCVKYAPGSRIHEQDLDPLLFDRLLPTLANAHKLIINGIGEPLLHPQLATFIANARRHLPTDSCVGLQSNGLLLDTHRAASLLAAGLSTICLSLDGLSEPPISVDGQEGHSLSAVDRAIGCLQEARQRIGTQLRIGLEIVIHQGNYQELPDMITWAAQRGVTFLLVSHLFHYTATQDDLFDPNPAPARALFQERCDRATARGLDMRDCLNVFNSFDRSADTLAKLAILNDICNDATQQGMHLHLAGLIERHHAFDPNQVEAILARSGELARLAGIDLDLPPLGAPAHRCCPFIENRAVCIAVDGRVMPCHFLWHGYACHVSGKAIQVRPRSFGTLRDRDLLSIWHDPDYRHFRQEAGAYQYAPCWSCPQGPCPDLVGGDSDYANDCYGSAVPCGHCQWSLGGIKCLS
ncbi:radical SAM/SPASM family putative metalloenzyme maturase [Desulfofustis limnaeus]|jgi:putative metalloenzyme radical SAM/SPASM domain maturase|uniref:Radical SAM protein n=1 Tax=Desulfofustis limnaeus TaxID=2740163 RepID=A0ABM7W9W6_9BACT|nr:radical SAM/SPASM family putative metalloenzyme maturase [Desulfofustis limnaeus]MDX9896389.1 radical SAM/SPASM family putative metalloenzyme maturase [Desulfofustis sp.]BDD87763.1 radical SAM protein [Desulfofustis limnaeus]